MSTEASASLVGHVVVGIKPPGSQEVTSYTSVFAVSVGGLPRWIVPVPTASIGLHIYATYYASFDAYEIVVRVSNGAVDEDGRGFAGAVYVEHLSVVFHLQDVPDHQQVTCIPAPGFSVNSNGTSTTLSIIQSTQLLMPRQMLNRRAALCKRTEMGMSMLLKSGPLRPATASLLPTFMPPPRPGLWRGEEGPALGTLFSMRSSGGSGTIGAMEHYTNHGALGEYIGNPHPGAAGGEGLEFQPGWEGAVGLRLILHDIAMNRMAVAAYNRATGEPIRRWTKKYEYQLSRGWAKLTKLPWTCAPQPNQYFDQREPLVYNANGKNALNELIPPEPFDGQHLIRGYRHGLAVLSWIHDRAVLDDLNMLLWDCRYSWTMDPAPATQWWTPFSLKGLRDKVNEKPGTGHPNLGREFGWVLTLGASLAHYLPSEHTEWVQQMALTAAKAQMGNGFYQALRYGSFFGAPDPWKDYAVPQEYEVAQGIEHGIVTYAMAAALRAAKMREITLSVSRAISSPIAIARRATGYCDPLAKWNMVTRLDRKSNQKPLSYSVPSGPIENFNIWAPMGFYLWGTERRRKFGLIESMLHYPVPDQQVSGKPKNAQELLEALRSSPHTAHLSPSIAALESL